jgi:hypothetical protein
MDSRREAGFPRRLDELERKVDRLYEHLDIEHPQRWGFGTARSRVDVPDCRRTCSYERTQKTLSSSRGEPRKGGSMRRMLVTAGAVVIACGLGAAPAGAATQLGQTFAPPDPCSGPVTGFQTTSPGSSYTVPSPGVITSWRFQADAAPPHLKLKVGRALGGNQFTIVGESALEAPAASGVNTFQTRVPVRAGDLLGFFISDAGNCVNVSASGYLFQQLLAPDPAPGTTRTFEPEKPAQFDLAAVLEPDCDNDGLGDESQDSAVDCVSPETTITKGPKDKTKKKQATFKFNANEPGATFECSLDGGAFAACTSPHRVKVKKGRHNFQVRAKDAANNTDGSPASDDWKVKKKRKRK